jgi:hypothetical protein
MRENAIKNTLLILALIIGMISFGNVHGASDHGRGNTQLCQSTDSQYKPKVNDDNRYVVGIGIQPIRLSDVSPSDGRVIVDFYLTIEYELSSAHPNVKCVGHLAHRVWERFYNPDIEIMTIHNPENPQGFHWMVEDNRFAYMTRIEGHATIVGDFRLFPFDELEIPIIVAGEDSSTYLDLIPSRWYHESDTVQGIQIPTQDISVPGWRIDHVKFTEVGTEWISESGEYWDELGIVLNMKREPATKVARGLLPLLILFLVTYGSHTLRDSKDLPSGRDRLVDTRIHVQIGALLALFAYTLYIMELIPATPYLTLGDLTWMGFMVAIGLVIASEYLPNSFPLGQHYLPVKKLAFKGAMVIVIAVALSYTALYFLHV